MTISLQARVVFPVDAPPIEHGVVSIEGERIVAIGKTAATAPVRDLGNVALLPAFVNAHTHLEFSHLRRPLGNAGMRLPDWIRLVIGLRAAQKGQPEDSIGVGLQESITSGALAIGEIAGEAWFGATQAERPLSLGSRLHPDPTLPAAVALVLFVEVIGFSRARAASVLNFLEERLDALFRIPGIQPAISPHAPYTVSPALLEKLVFVAGRRHLPLAMHLAEGADELQLLANGTGPFQELLDERSMWDGSAIPAGSRPLDYLRALAAAPRSLVIHGNYLDAEERDFLAAQRDRMSLVYCPRTHAYFQHPPYPLAELLAAGVRVALGTDSRASNPDLDLLAEMRHVARVHPQIAPTEILRMGTLAGAQALGCDAQFGSLAPGKEANLVAVPLPAGATGTADELLSAVLHSSDRPSGIWLRGQKLPNE